jgi:hypothetical protein
MDCGTGLTESHEFTQDRDAWFGNIPGFRGSSYSRDERPESLRVGRAC